MRTVSTVNCGKGRKPLLSRRPGESAAREQMKLNMKYRLSSISSVVDDQSVSAFVKSSYFGKVPSDKEQVSNSFLVFLAHVLDIRDMFSGYNQNVRRSLRIDVFKRNRHFVFVHEYCRDFAIDDLAK